MKQKYNSKYTPINKYLGTADVDSRGVVKAIISRPFKGGFNLELQGTDFDYSIPLPTLEVIFKILRGPYRRAIGDGKDFEIHDRDKKISVKYGELYKILNLEEKARQLELDEKRIRRARRKFGPTPTRSRKKIEPKVLHPREKTW